MDASLAYGADQLLSHADLSVEEHERICLVGRNGAGKSTLLKVIAGERELDDGRIVKAASLRVTRLEQDPPDYAEGTAYTMAASKIPVVGKALAKFAVEDNPEEQGRLADFIEENDGWKQDGEVRKILSNIGIEPDMPLATLSGGWRRKAALASALVTDPDVLLLDEPTNHLDIETIEWVEQFVNNFRGTVIFITHDRQFADDCASRIVELDRGKLYSYPGSFNKYMELREERFRMEDIKNREFDRILSEEEAWIRRGVKARLARNEGRVRNLEQMRLQRAQRRDRTGKAIMQVNEADRTGNIVFDLRDVSMEFGGRTVIKPFSATVMRRDRIGIVGPNGAGKTTLIRCILGELKPTHGYIRTGMNVQPVYFDQYHEQLNPQKTVAENVADGHTEVVINGKSKHVISYLSNFLFTGRRARSPVSVLSGGEKNRLLLARLFAKPSNVLVMDEPTNDLDLETLDLLEDLVASYPGTVVVISHDRRFIDHVATETWVFDGQGGIEDVVGGWRDVLAYWERTKKNREVPAEQKSAKAAAEKEKPRKREKRKGLTFTEEHELGELPSKVEAMEKDLAALDAELADPSLYADGGAKAADLVKKRQDAQDALDAAYARWEELEEKAGEGK
jgi:ATP-binding cassette subfamily F protein uup